MRDKPAVINLSLVRTCAFLFSLCPFVVVVGVCVLSVVSAHMGKHLVWSRQSAARINTLHSTHAMHGDWNRVVCIIINGSLLMSVSRL